MKVSHLTEATAMWDLLTREYAQARSESMTYCLRRLMHIMLLRGDISVHINEFQEAIRYLANINFLLVEHVAAGILLSSLPYNPSHPNLWDYFTKSTKITI